MMASGLSNLHQRERNRRALQLRLKGLDTWGLRDDHRWEVHVNTILLLILIFRYLRSCFLKLHDSCK